MNRTIWIVFAALLVGFLAYAKLAGHGAAAPAGAGGGASAVVACRLPGGAIGPGPHQSDVPSEVRAFAHGEFTVSPLAAFAIEAKVLGREDYTFDAESALSPTDLALGWDRMADPAVYEPLSISQGGRWYRYQWGNAGPPIPLDEIVRSSANMHMIPADDGVAAALARVRPEQTVRLRGWLVEVRRPDGWHWRSSLTRDDSGDGSCELIYVCSLDTR